MCLRAQNKMNLLSHSSLLPVVGLSAVIGSSTARDRDKSAHGDEGVSSSAPCVGGG